MLAGHRHQHQRGGVRHAGGRTRRHPLPDHAAGRHRLTGEPRLQHTTQHTRSEFYIIHIHLAHCLSLQMSFDVTTIYCVNPPLPIESPPPPPSYTLHTSFPPFNALSLCFSLTKQLLQFCFIYVFLIWKRRKTIFSYYYCYFLDFKAFDK